MLAYVRSYHVSLAAGIAARIASGVAQDYNLAGLSGALKAVGAALLFVAVFLWLERDE